MSHFVFKLRVLMYNCSYRDTGVHEGVLWSCCTVLQVAYRKSLSALILWKDLQGGI